MENRRPIILFALLYSACFTGIRYFIILENHTELFNVGYPFRMLLGGITEFTAGLLFGAILYSMRRKFLAEAFLVLGIGLVLLVEIVCFHYEAVFGRLPASDLLFYLGEIRHLGPSLNVNLPAGRVLIEFTVIMLVLYFGFRSLRSPGPKGISRVTGIAAVVMVLFSIFVQCAPGLVSDRYIWSSRQPLLWLAQSYFIKESYQFENLKLTDGQFAEFRKIHGGAGKRPLLNPDFPFCLAPKPVLDTGNSRSVILLILEGVSTEEMYGRYRSQEIMPNLQRIAGENLMFNHVYAPGTKSVSALPAIFSGMPGNPFNNYLWNEPSIKLAGFPEQLDRRGYTTAYFHGGDLAFERQRIYLRKIGFHEINEYDPAGDTPIYGWGYDDERMFRKLEQWITRRQGHGRPYLATLFTLSTHDPYELPDDWQPRFPDDRGVYHAMVESYMYLDRQLGGFYDWYRQHGDNTIVLITGDHTPHVVNEGEITKNYEMRFDVPLIIAGLTTEELNRYRPFADRVAGLHDMPATIMALLGLEQPSCDLGINLVQPDSTWPAHRVVYAFGGDTLERMHMWFDEQEIVLDRLRNQFRHANRNNRAILTNTVTPEILAQARSYVDTIFPVHYYLLQKNRYAISTEDRKFRSTRGLARPVLVSHRGNINGASPAGTENSAAALDAVVNSAFRWVEVDVQLTRDGALVLHHDHTVVIDGVARPLLELSLAELRAIPDYADTLTLEEALDKYSSKLNMLIEIKPQEHVKHLAHLSREVVRILSNQPDRRRFIVDSFHEYLAGSIKFGCDCAVGFDADYKKFLGIPDLERIADLGVDWVYVDHSVVNRELIGLAHAHGLKVMAYTVNDAEIIRQWQAQGGMPDGIITDYESIIGELN